jgi:hypothetical protein
MCIFSWQGPYSNAIVETDWSIISIQSNNLYINDILLPAQIIIVALWIEFLCIVSDIVYYDQFYIQ